MKSARFVMSASPHSLSLGALVLALTSCSEFSTAPLQLETEAPGENCAQGGQRVEVRRDGKLTTAFVCRGDGADVVLSIEEEPVGENCTQGGQALVSRTTDGETLRSYVCEGEPTTVIATREPAGKNCATGGVRLVDEAGTTYVCHGKAGDDGARLSVTADSEVCERGGAKLQVGSGEPVFVCSGSDTLTYDAMASTDDCPAGGISLQVGTRAPVYVCNGEDGSDGDDFIVSVLPSGPTCAEGGVSIVAGDSAPVTNCDGLDGKTVKVTSIAPGVRCATGGLQVEAATGTPYYICRNGSSWETVSTPKTLTRNRAYLAKSAQALTLTLPTTTSLTIGDIVRVLNGGSAFVHLMPNSGQTFAASAALAPLSSLVSRETSRAWTSVAASADGTTLVAAAEATYPATAGVYVSTDSGASWSQKFARSEIGRVASSADGNVLIYGGDSGSIWGSVHVSTNRGASWTSHLDGIFAVKGVASSFDGSQLAVASWDGIFVRRNDTWTQVDNSRAWSAIACSADCSRLIASTYSETLFISSDYGASWTTSGAAREWNSVSSSADGRKLFASVAGGQLYTSTDYGVSWTARETNRNWTSVSSSADGTRLAAVVDGGALYLSSDSGVTWRVHDGTAAWRGVALSSNGKKLIGGATASALRVSGSGVISLDAYSSVELVYAGNGVFQNTSATGTVLPP